jgi:outer membrane lipoprotein-sorting protein
MRKHMLAVSMLLLLSACAHDGRPQKDRAAALKVVQEATEDITASAEKNLGYSYTPQEKYALSLEFLQFLEKYYRFVTVKPHGSHR